jgi:methylmalonyl-CoA mutase C-terminal domain/subunit
MVSTPMPGTRRVRVLIAKPGLDGHDRGAKVLTRALRDAGMEVIYTGLHQTPQMVAEAALQEDVDAVGLSILSGAHMALFPRVIEELRKRGIEDVPVYAGGIIPDEDVSTVLGWGIRAVFGPGATLDSIAHLIEEDAHARHAALDAGQTFNPASLRPAAEVIGEAPGLALPDNFGVSAEEMGHHRNIVRPNQVHEPPAANSATGAMVEPGSVATTHAEGKSEGQA